ncbi:MAG TPA: amino acid adenylation domain-containing protein [Longimicrobium sp.]|nr:amino acid adenylation domain-containing protein [Longimicrobium sp.]
MSILDEKALGGERLELFLRMLDEEGIVGAPGAEPIPRREGAADAPASFAQRRLWLVDRLEPGSAAYNVPVFWRLRGTLDAAALGRALSAVADRHEALRTTFAERQGEPVQVVAPAVPISLAVDDLTALDPAARLAEAERRAADEAARPFDLAAGPLLRARLLRLAADDHVLLLTLHHAVCDAWSLTVVFRELSALYDAERSGIPAALAPLPLQYGDYAAWQRSPAQVDALREAMGYWRAKLAGAPPLQLPADRPRPAALSDRGGGASLDLGGDATAAARALARREGATPFAVLLSAFAVLAGRWARQDDVVVGMAVAGRTRRELEPLAGNFVNLLALRADLAGDPTGRELIARVSSVVTEALERQEVPFERLVEVVQPDRALGRTPLAQVAFGYQDASERALRLAGLVAEPFRAEAGTTHFDLTLNVIDQDGRLRAECLYSTDLFDTETIDRFLAQFATVLAALAAGPEMRISALPLVGRAERARLLAAGAASAPEQETATLHERFASRAARTPHAVAITCEDESLTYGELDARANRLARHLQALGVGPETRVGLCVERSAEMVVAILGVLKAGGAYVPLDPAHPAERLAYVIDDAGIGILLTQERLLETLPASSAELVCLDRDWPVIAALTGDAPASAVVPGNTAYVIYTSGSTGKPKGCAVTHANVTRLFSATDAWFGFGEADVWTLFHSVAFDFSVWEIWGALLYGGRLVVVPYLTSRSPDEFHALLEREGVTVLSQTPSAFRQLARVDEDAAVSADARPLALRLVVFGGEALEPASLRGWVARHGDAAPRLVNMYGITETTVHVTYRPITRAEVEGGSSSVIGIPIPDLPLHLLDARGEPAPVGVPGEIHVGGAGVSRGYLGRPSLTAQRFVPDPFSGVPGARLYRSGDLARRRSDGDLEYLGRIDEQVKVRGFRIEPGEIEAVLAAHPAVGESVVLVAEDEPGDRQLVAFVAACNGHAPEWPELRAFLRASLPDALVPAACVVVDALPLTPNGKVDRRALLALDREGRAADHGFVAPRTPTEETLAGVWRGVLGIERIGVHESFFALGGDSIRAIRVLSGARERGVPLTLAQLFAHQTVAELAAELGGAADDPVPFVRTAPFSLVSPEDRLRLPPVVEDAYPLARMQAGMLYHAALDPDHPVYHNLNSFHLSLGWDEGCFRRAVAAVVERHPILRTGFAMEEFEEPLQLVHRSAVLELGVSDLRALPADAQERELAAHRDAELARPFDLARPTLLRFHVHRLSDGGFQFTLTECHAILDGWSLTSTLAELFELYAALLAGHPLPDAAPLEVSFRDFVDMERRALESPACRDFWEGRLRGAVPRRIPRLPRPEADGRRLEALDIHVPDEVHRALRRLEREEGLPLKTLLLAAHLKVLSLLQGGREVISGLAMNGRPEVEGGDRIRGLFLNTVPFRAELEPGSWAALARRVLQAEREILPFRRYPVSALHEGRRLEPLFEASFNFVHFHRLGDFLKTAAVEARGGLWERADTNFTLVASFGVGMVTGGLRLFLACDRAELSDEQVETAAALYPAVLRAIAGHPHARHDGGDLLGGALLTRVVAEGIGPVAAVGPRGLHRVLERRAAATPDAPAVACGAERLSYAALDRRASRIARQLRALGVGAETRVAVCVPRSADRVAAILGVLKAGGTALPLDPDASPRRRAETAAALEARVMVTRDGTRADGFATLALDLDTVAVSAESPAASDVFVPPGALALVLAVPEPRGGVGGVLLPHAAMASTAAALAGELGAGEGTRWALAAPAGSPLEVLELFAALAAGAELHFAPPAHAEELESFLLESDAGAAVLPPAALARLSPERLPSLTAVAVHGAVCPAGVAAEWGPGGRLVSAFGPAEAGMLALAERLDGASPPLSTGRPVANARVHVLDDALDPVAAGVAGEVCVGGDGVARGYAGRPGLTAERFVPDAWSGEPGARLFRTGARGRRLGGGAVELLDLAEPALAWDEAEPADEDDLAAVPLPPVVATGRTGLLPLSFAQERLWFLDRMEPGSALYNVPAALRLRGALDAHALERALGEIVRRHEALRTTFREEDDAPVQVVAPFDGFTLHLDDLSSLDEAKREAELARRVDGETTLPFDLSAGPLLRARLLRLGGEEHVLLLCMHHIVSDGWSLRVLYRELWALYAAYRGGAESPLPELAVQYADYAAWQREHLRGRALDRQLAWWKEQLAGAPALLELPTDRPRPAVQTHRGGQVALDLPGDAVERLRALGRSEGATPFMVLLAAVQVLLGRYTGTDDVVVGSPMAGRTQEVEGLIGFFANTLVLRTDLSGDPGFREVLQRVRGVTLGAGEHQAVPFEKVVEALQPERSLGRSPLFQVMVQMAGAFVPATVATGMSAERVELRNGTTRFDLTFAFVEREDGVRGVLDYATDLFDDATAERMARHLALLLEQVADDPDLAISRASLADEAERARLQAWSGTDAEDASAGFVHRRFAEQAARTPDAVAVTHRGDLLTYRELDARSNRLAHHLRGRGIASETAVGICLERTPEMVVAVLAVLKAGGAYVPLDPSYPADRLAFMLEDAGVALVVTQESLRARLPALAGVELLSVDGLREALAAKDDAPVDGGADGRGLAYVIYTSGSTGRPKGVAVEHGGLAAYLDWACRTYPGRGSAVHSSLSFDLTVTSLFVPLLGGGCVDLVEEAAGVDGLAARFRSGGVHGMLKLTPAHLRLLGEQLNRADLSAGPECLVVGGEALLGEHLELWKRRLPDTVVVNEYGPTETVVGCCIHVVRAGDAEAGRVPIGRPSPGTRLYVLDANGLQAPAGIPGELYIGGAQVARGYVGRPSLTAERFVPDPFSGRPGARLYRTGDRARWMESAEVRECGSAFASAREERTPALPHFRTRLPRPTRRAGEGPRLPRRAGRDRGSPPSPSAGRRLRRRRP